MSMVDQPVLSAGRLAPAPPGYKRPAGLPTYTVKTIAEVVPRLPGLPCATCRGRLHVEWPFGGQDGRIACLGCGREVAAVVEKLPPARLPLTGEDATPCRGRPPKSLTEQQPEVELCIDCNLRQPKYQRRRCWPCTGERAGRLRRHLCLDCPQTVIGPQNARCPSCANAHQWATSLAGRLIALLADRQEHHRDDLYVALECSGEQLRHGIKRARARGHVIKLRRATYRLEGVDG